MGGVRVLVFPHTSHSSTQGPVVLCKFMLISFLYMVVFHPSDTDQGTDPVLYTLYSNKLGLI